jgi:hypothetical protein
MGSNPLIMKYLCLLFTLYLLAGCGNKKAEIVEEIKKVKTEWLEVENMRATYSSVANKLKSYEMARQNIKNFGRSDQAEMQMKIYKESYEKATKELNNVSPSILKDQNKLDSIALMYEIQTWSLKHKIDSLELELKKY